MRARPYGIVALLLAASGGLISLPARAGAATSQTTTQEECQSELLLFELYAAGVATTLQPADGAEVTKGSPVTLSGESAIVELSSGHPEEVPLSFEVASSAKALANPDLGSGPGTPGPGSEPNRRKYTFRSTRAAQASGTVYWQASFTRHLEKCNGGENHTFTTGGGFSQPFTLSVVSPSEQPVPPPAPGGPHTSYSPPSTTGLKVGITASPVVHIGHPAVAYLVECTAQCTGETYFRAWQLRGRHHKPARAKALDFGPRSVSISGASGGNARFAAHFRGRTLKKLRGMLRGGNEVKLVVWAKVKDAKGNAVQVQRTILLKR